MADNVSDTGAGQSEQSEQTQPNGHTTAPQQTLRVRNERREREGRRGREREKRYVINIFHLLQSYIVADISATGLFFLRMTTIACSIIYFISTLG